MIRVFTQHGWEWLLIFVKNMSVWLRAPAVSKNTGSGTLHNSYISKGWLYFIQQCIVGTIWSCLRRGTMFILDNNHLFFLWLLFCGVQVHCHVLCAKRKGAIQIQMSLWKINNKHLESNKLFRFWCQSVNVMPLPAGWLNMSKSHTGPQTPL